MLTSVAVGPLLLATFFVAAEYGMVPPWTNEYEGGHCQPSFYIFNIYVARSKGCGVHPNLKL